MHYPLRALKHSPKENIVLKYHLIPTRTVGEKAFWKTTDRQKFRQTARQNDETRTDTSTDSEGRLKLSARQPAEERNINTAMHSIVRIKI